MEHANSSLGSLHMHDMKSEQLNKSEHIRVYVHQQCETRQYHYLISTTNPAISLLNNLEGAKFTLYPFIQTYPPQKGIPDTDRNSNRQAIQSKLIPHHTRTLQKYPSLPYFRITNQQKPCQIIHKLAIPQLAQRKCRCSPRLTIIRRSRMDKNKDAE